MTLPAPLQKNLEKLIDRATSEEMTKPDLELYQEVCNAINSRNEMPREAIRLLTRKISSGKPKVQFLALELLEATTCGCELPFHTQLGQKDFLRLLSMLLQRDPVEPVKVKLLYLFQFWSEFFDSHKDLLPQFAELYQGLRKKGIGFPAPQSTKYNSLKKSGGHSTSSHRSDHRSAPPEPSAPQDPAKLAKFRQELELVKENLQTANEMIDAANPKDDIRRNDVLIDLMKALKEVEEKLKKAIAELNDEVTLQVCLDLNDDLNQTLERYDALKKNKKPAPFFRARDFIEKERELASKPGYNDPAPKKATGGGGGGFWDDGFGGFSGETKSPGQKPAPKASAQVDLLGESEPVTTNVPSRGGAGTDFLGGAPTMPTQPTQPKSNPSDLLGMNLNVTQPQVMQPMVPQQPVQQQQKPDIFAMLPGVQPQYPNQGMMQPGMQQGMQQGGFRQQPQMGGFPAGGMMQPGMNPGMMGMNPGMMGMNPGMMQQGMNPGMMGMNPGMMGMNPMSPGLGGGVMSPGLAQNRGPAPTASQYGKPAGTGIRMDSGPQFPNQPSQAQKNAVASPFDDIVDNIVSTEMTKKDIKAPAPVQQPPKQADFGDLI